MKESELLTEMLVAIGRAVKEAGDAGIPSGHVYARLMGLLSLDQYNQILSLMVRAGVIENENHLLKFKA